MQPLKHLRKEWFFRWGKTIFLTCSEFFHLDPCRSSLLWKQTTKDVKTLHSDEGSSLNLHELLCCSVHVCFWAQRKTAVWWPHAWTCSSSELHEDLKQTPGEKVAGSTHSLDLVETVCLNRTLSTKLNTMGHRKHRLQFYQTLQDKLNCGQNTLLLN